EHVLEFGAPLLAQILEAAGLRVALFDTAEQTTELNDQVADARFGDRVSAVGAHEHVIRGEGDSFTGAGERNIARRCQGVSLALILAVDVDHFAILPFLAEPFEINAPRLLAELEEHEFLRPVLAVDLFATTQPDNVRVDAGVTVRGEFVQLAQ